MAKFRPVGHEDRLSVVEHLDELRWRVVISVSAFAVALALCFWQNHLILRIVNHPLRHYHHKPTTFGVAEPFILHPGEFVLGQTLERVTLPDDLVARLEGKSSLGRLGLLIHSTAGFVDSGFSGNLTLELSNVANLPITIYHGMPIGQISFMRMDGPVERPYGSGETGSKYQGQGEPTPSRFYLNFERTRSRD